MQVGNTDTTPLQNFNRQTTRPPLNPETAVSRRNSESSSPTRPASSQIIEAEYVDLHQPLRQPVAPKPQSNNFILESVTRGKTRPASNNTEMTPLQKTIGHYLQFEKDPIPAGIYLDFYV